MRIVLFLSSLPRRSTFLLPLSLFARHSFSPPEISPLSLPPMMMPYCLTLALLICPAVARSGILLFSLQLTPNYPVCRAVGGPLAG
ncbi:hypothetical protein BDW74DRAFT_106244 [Aspergillus multicolor]|uniref:uncharacterized protein n=1 Tax=Aspergillus multicolor TaxID=41759 RepID=UPI003CCDB545